MTEIGRGSRRTCLRMPDSGLCIKRYRDDDGVGETVRREISHCRFDRARNTCAQEYDYVRSLAASLPPDVFAVFPETMELKEDPVHGWYLVESLVLNGDGSVPERFSRTCGAADAQMRHRLLAAYCNLVHAFMVSAVRFYDPQNVLVQWERRPFESAFRLRIVDFEPASRAFISVDLVCPALRRMKVYRRVKRYLRQHVGAAYNPLPWRERVMWDGLIASEGARLGLSDGCAFLENKFINDIFYEGRFRGKACIVKCSSRVPGSIRNEYELASRLYAVAPSAVPEPLAVWTSEGGRRAFVVTEEVSGPTLTELLAQGVTDEQADGFAADIGRLADALKETGIVHRDLFSDNLILGADGHLKAIDWQLAVDRNDYREDPWVERHWKFRYVVFGVNRELGLGVWNDFHALVKILAQLPQTDAVRAAAARLATEGPAMVFASPPDAMTRLKLRLYAVSLRLQMAWRGRRHRKYAQLERRYRTIVGKI